MLFKAESSSLFGNDNGKGSQNTSRNESGESSSLSSPLSSCRVRCRKTSTDEDKDDQGNKRRRISSPEVPYKVNFDTKVSFDSKVNFDPSLTPSYNFCPSAFVPPYNPPTTQELPQPEVQGGSGSRGYV